LHIKVAGVVVEDSRGLIVFREERHCGSVEGKDVKGNNFEMTADRYRTIERRKQVAVGRVIKIEKFLFGSEKLEEAVEIEAERAEKSKKLAFNVDVGKEA
jgi:hypothetical protein